MRMANEVEQTYYDALENSEREDERVNEEFGVEYIIYKT